MSVSRLFVLVPIMITVIFVSACTRPYSKEIEPDKPFKGLSDYNESRLFMMHGMCHHDKKWFEDNVTVLKK